jgi:DNA polymerase-3 subunit delta'
MPWLAAPRAAMAAMHQRGVHALLLHGPAGVGKWDLAVRFAGDVLCENPAADGAACGACASCRLTAAGNHPDLRVIVPDALAERRPGASGESEEAPVATAEPTATKAKPSREIKIDQVRELASLVGISAHRGGARVVILGPAEALNLSAANSLLKGLEEPPAGTLFLLVSDQIDHCLPTIVSRCSLVRIPVPPREAALQWLRDQGMGDEAVQRLMESGGAPLAALRDTGQALDPQMHATLLALLRRGAALTAADIVENVPRTVPIGPAVAFFQRWVWDYFSFRLGGGLRYHPDEARCFEALGQHWSVRAAGDWADRLRRLRAIADHPLNARSAVEGILLDYVGSIAQGGQGLQPAAVAMGSKSQEMNRE